MIDFRKKLEESRIKQMAVMKKPTPPAAKKAAAPAKQAPAPAKQVAAAPAKTDVTKAMVKTGSAPVAKASAASMFAADSGAGLAGMKKEDFLIPRLKIAQDLTPAVKSTKAEYIPGLEIGMIFDPVSGRFWDGGKGILLVLVQFQKTYPEYVPRKKGGGFVGMHDETVMLKTKFIKGEGFMLPNSNEIVPTIEYLSFLVNEEDGSHESVVISFNKTDMTEARRLSTVVTTYKETIQDESGNDIVLAPPALFFRSYRFTAAMKTKDKNEWFGWHFVPEERTIDLFADSGDGMNLYNAARAFKEQIAKGEVKVTAPGSEDAPATQTMDESAPM